VTIFVHLKQTKDQALKESPSLGQRTLSAAAKQPERFMFNATNEQNNRSAMCENK
jgi:hypothetical protein